jgi:hypothetical protein
MIRHDPGDRHLASRQHDLFACLGTRDELQERCLGGSDGESFHGSSFG